MTEQLSSPPQERSANPSSDDEREIVTKRRKIAADPSLRRSKQDIVTTTNKLSSDEFKSRFLPQSMLRYQSDSSSTETSTENTHVIDFSYALDLADLSLERCFKLVESTSRSDYHASSRGWRPGQKRTEMRQTELRYLTVKRRSNAENDSTGQKDEGCEGDMDFQGFLSFMVTHEDGFAVIYVYEIHLTESARGKGLGQHLFSIIEKVAEQLGPAIEKVMLTCFVANTSAVQFYHRLGFDVDGSSPRARKIRGKLISPDYVILSKLMKQANDTRT
jgi:ribosomal protein S18 acetylase RimI-like enzyme